MLLTSPSRRCGVGRGVGQVELIGSGGNAVDAAHLNRVLVFARFSGRHLTLRNGTGDSPPPPQGAANSEKRHRSYFNAFTPGRVRRRRGVFKSGMPHKSAASVNLAVVGFQ